MNTAPTTTVPILCRLTEDGKITATTCHYEGPVSLRVWKTLNHRLLRMDNNGYFYPFDALDAYNEAVRKLIRAADHLARGKIVLHKAQPDTYLTKIALNTLYGFHKRQVRPYRDIYRLAESRLANSPCLGSALAADPSADPCLGSALAADDPDTVSEAPTDTTPCLDFRDLAENLPASPTARERHARAVIALNEIFRILALHRQTTIIRAFRAYITAGGRMVDAANLMNIATSTFYDSWPDWLATTRKLIGVPNTPQEVLPCAS